jgi:hypothetical protein
MLGMRISIPHSSLTGIQTQRYSRKTQGVSCAKGELACVPTFSWRADWTCWCWRYLADVREEGVGVGAGGEWAKQGSTKVADVLVTAITALLFARS